MACGEREGGYGRPACLSFCRERAAALPTVPEAERSAARPTALTLPQGSGTRPGEEGMALHPNPPGRSIKESSTPQGSFLRSS